MRVVLPVISWLLFAGAGVIAGALAALFGLWAVAGVLAVVLIALFVRYPAFGLAAFFASVVAGQLVRVSVLGGAVVVSDVVAAAVIVAFAVGILVRQDSFSMPSVAAVPLIAFLLIAALSLLFSVRFLPTGEVLSGAGYWVRLFLYSLLFFVGAGFCHKARHIGLIILLFVGSAIALSLLGFVQLIVFPDFSFMVPQGWDPHIGRLLSTWFDPNLLGGYLAISALTVIAVLLERVRVRSARVGLLVGWSVALLVITAGLTLTYSRSALLAFLVGFVLLGIMRSRTLLMAGILAGALIFISSPRIQERVQGALQVDVTASARITSWNNTFKIISDYPWLGVGFNTMRFVQYSYGFTQDSAEHSAGGSDSSLLTIFATMGIAGIVAFLWLLVSLARIAWRQFRARMDPPSLRGLGLGLLVALPVLLIHSMFTNSLLYPHILGPLFLLFGAIAKRELEAKDQKSRLSTPDAIPPHYSLQGPDLGTKS